MEQKTLYDKIIEWVKNQDKNSNRSLMVNGLAGTGKTTLLSHLSSYLSKSYFQTAIVSLTGRAVVSITEKFDKYNINRKGLSFSTIHSFLYNAKIMEVETGVSGVYDIFFEFLPRKELDDIFELLFIDEASMIGEGIFNDLKKLKIPKIFFGDLNQLPPIENGNNSKGFNISDHVDCNLYLKTPIRNVNNYDIILTAIKIAENGFVPSDINSENLRRLDWNKNGKNLWEGLNHSNNNFINLAYRNKTKTKLNSKIRGIYDFKENAPYPGEKVVILKNNYTYGIFNGEIYKCFFSNIIIGGNESLLKIRIYDENTIKNKKTILTSGLFFNGISNILDIARHEKTIRYKDSIKDGVIKEIEYDNLLPDINLKRLSLKALSRLVRTFIVPVDYGYVITIHKSQGSEWGNVVIFDDFNFLKGESYSRLFYTAITRSKGKVIVFNM